VQAETFSWMKLRMSMSNNLPYADVYVNHIRNFGSSNIPDMVNSKKILWENLRTLMIMKYGEENPWRTAHEAGIGPGTMTRIKQQETSTGVDTLEKLANLFKVEVWQLLVPGIGQQELRVMQHMKSMCDDQKDTIATISYSLAQPKAKYGNEK
jgi:hypothetical protein